MSDVYFSKEIDKIINKVDWNSLGKNVAIKTHFGEKGCTTYLSPEIVKKVYDKIVSLGKSATLVECNVLYKGSRTNKTEHIKTAHSHGFNFAPIDILDGELGNEDLKVDVDNKDVYLGKGLGKYDSMIVLTHFKGHMMAGYGGAIKNIGMGLGSRKGKLHMHSNISPSVKQEKCIACQKCIENCPVKAISFKDGKAWIDSTLCIGCAMCIAICPTGAIGVPWRGGTSETLQKNIVLYSKGVLNLIPKTLFINFLINITEDCDCMNFSQKPIMNDVGIVYSTDIVSIDKASLDLVNEKSNNLFEKINLIDKSKLIDYANSRGLGSCKYRLIDLDNSKF